MLRAFTGYVFNSGLSADLSDGRFDKRSYASSLQLDKQTEFLFSTARKKGLLMVYSKSDCSKISRLSLVCTGTNKHGLWFILLLKSNVAGLYKDKQAMVLVEIGSNTISTFHWGEHVVSLVCTGTDTRLSV